MSTRAKVSKEERQHCKGVDGNQWKSQREITSEGTESHLSCLLCVCVCVCMLSHFSHIWLNDLMDSSLRGSPVHGFLQARTLEQVVVTYSRGSSPSRDRTQVSYVSCIDRRVRYYCHLGSPADIAMCVYNVSIVLSHQLKYKSSDGKWLLGLTHSCILSTR